MSIEKIVGFFMTYKTYICLHVKIHTHVQSDRPRKPRLAEDKGKSPKPHEVRFISWKIGHDIRRRRPTVGNVLDSDWF